MRKLDLLAIGGAIFLASAPASVGAMPQDASRQWEFDPSLADVLARSRGDAVVLTPPVYARAATEHYGKDVVVISAKVDAVHAPTAFTLREPGCETECEVLVLTPRELPIQPGQELSVRGTLVQFHAGEMQELHVPAELAQRYDGRPALIAKWIRRVEGGQIMPPNSRGRPMIELR
ncbi:MAG: hypothetical protein AB7V27_15250 [Candidatus Binatia bacterium]